MAVQSFTPVSGGSPDRQFIATCALDTASRDWAINGSSGYYIIQSATFKSGYVIFSDGTNKTGTPIGLAVNVPFAFNTIFLMGIAGDQFTLYKVSPKTTTSVASPFSRFTISHTSITSSTTHNFPALNLPVADLLLIGGGGGGGHHGGGGGGGGAYIYLTKYPMSAVNPVTIPGRAGVVSKGGSTSLGGIIAEGGGFGGEHSGSVGNPGGNGANGGGAGGGHLSNGSSTTAGSASSIPSLPFGFTYAGAYYGNYAGGHPGGTVSGSANSWNLRGAGGGGALGAGSNGNSNGGGNGGAGIISPFDSGTHHNQYYCAGGRGSQHSPGQVGSNGNGWTDGGYGCGGAAHHDSTPSSTHGGQGLVAYRGYS